MKPNIRWIVLVILISAVLIFALATEWWGILIELAAVLVGYYVGDFLMLGAYRLFDWGESAVRYIAWGVGVGGGIIWFILTGVLEPPGTREYNLATIALAGFLGIIVGAVTRAIAVSKQLQAEDRGP